MLHDIVVKYKNRFKLLKNEVTSANEGVKELKNVIYDFNDITGSISLNTFLYLSLLVKIVCIARTKLSEGKPCFFELYDLFGTLPLLLNLS